MTTRLTTAEADAARARGELARATEQLSRCGALWAEACREQGGDGQVRVSLDPVLMLLASPSALCAEGELRDTRRLLDGEREAAAAARSQAAQAEQSLAAAEAQGRAVEVGSHMSFHQQQTPASCALCPLHLL